MNLRILSATSRHLVVLCWIAADAIGAAEPAQPSATRPSFSELLKKHSGVTAEQLVKQAREGRPMLERLSFEPNDCKYYDRIQNKIPLTAQQQELFHKQGFVSLSQPHQVSFGTAYDQIFHKELPVLITSDSILHVLHRSFDNTLKSLEESGLSPLIDDVLTKCHQQLARRAIRADDPLLANDHDVDLYLSVARSLLKGNAVESAFGRDADVRRILANVDSLILQDPLLGQFTEIYGGRRAMDYSQFKPRGHYTQSSALQNYFRAMMWLGRADSGFFVTPASSDSGIVSRTSREVRDAVLLVDLLSETRQLERLQAADRCLEFLVGVSDNLKPIELHKLLDDERITLAAIVQPDGAQRLHAALTQAQSAAQQIKSQVILGSKVPGIAISPPGLFQIFGQRFAVDSFVLSKVVYDTVPRLPGRGTRQMPWGLDVIAALGNSDAVPLLSEELSRWQYAPHLAAAQDFTANYLSRDGRPTVYNLWLKMLTTLHQDMSHEPYFPQAMLMPAWRHKQLHTQLASWAELRHDTILFVKQSYSKRPECDYPSGNVEPYPEFFAQARRFTEGMREAVVLMQLPGVEGANSTLGKAPGYWRSAAETMQKLEDLARKELAGAEFTKAEQDFLKQTIEIRRKDIGGCGVGPWEETFTGWYANLLFPDLKAWMKPSPTVADVHTDPLGSVLEVGVGDVHLAIVAINHGTDRMAYVGPIYTYYEFAQPATDRMTNEQFNIKLRSGQPPPRPEWIRAFEQ